jgi:hypothetical protein
LGNKNLNPQDIDEIKKFISECTVIDISQGIKDYTIIIRQNTNLKLPDCIILATSQWMNMPLITADQDFKKLKNADLIFFKR